MNQLTIEKADFAALARIAGHVDFFTPFKGAELEIMLSHIHLYGYSKGETIFKKGQAPDAFYIVYEGRVRIRLNPRWFAIMHKQAILNPGNLFGEMAILENRPRSATAIATQPTKLFVLFRKEFDMLVQRNPLFADGMRLLAERRKFEDAH